MNQSNYDASHEWMHGSHHDQEVIVVDNEDDDKENNNMMNIINDPPSSIALPHPESFNSTNVIFFENKVKWKEEQHILSPLKKVTSVDQALVHLRSKSHYTEHLNNATNEEEKSMIRNIYNILEEFITDYFDDAQSTTIHVLKQV